MVKKTTLIGDKDPVKFMELLNLWITKYTDDGLVVDVQYATYKDKYTALILAREGN